MKRSLIIILLLTNFAVLLQAQTHISRQIAELEKDFRSFQYTKVLEKGNFLLTDPYVTKEDSLQILKYMLNSAYALADTVEAKKIIHKIIKCDANFTLDPVETSPKIIEFFEHVKKQIKAHKPIIPYSPKIKTIIKPASLPLSSSFFTLLLPGSGHLHQKFKRKGFIYTGVSTVMLGGLYYTIVKTDQKRSNYLAARPGADFEKLYKEYDTFYKIRNILFTTFLIWDLYVYYDLQKTWKIHLKTQVKSESISMQISWKW